jgi:hypothetical protein
MMLGLGLELFSFVYSLSLVSYTVSHTTDI